MIKVVRGNPTPEELAAALAVVQARAAATAAVSSGAPAVARAVVRPGPNRPAGPASAGPTGLGTDVLARLAPGGPAVRSHGVLAGPDPPVGPGLRRAAAQRPGPYASRRLSTRTQAPWRRPQQDRDHAVVRSREQAPKELRDAQDMMRRVWLVLALAMVVAMFVLGTR